MAKMNLDLSHVLDSLDDNLRDTMDSLCPEVQYGFDVAIDDFITKYGASPYNSMDDLLAASFQSAQYTAAPAASLDDILGELIS